MRVRRDLIRHVTTHQYAQSNFSPSFREHPHASRIYVNLSAINPSTAHGDLSCSRTRALCSGNLAMFAASLRASSPVSSDPQTVSRIS
jgi:hypothetical protein